MFLPPGQRGIAYYQYNAFATNFCLSCLDNSNLSNYNKCECEPCAFNPQCPHINKRSELKSCMYTDKVLICKECGQEFVFTAGEQEFYAEKGFQNEPMRCKACRTKRKTQRNEGVTRNMYTAVCADCGRECTVPFEPRGDRPVYCSECFTRHKQRQFV